MNARRLVPGTKLALPFLFLGTLVACGGGGSDAEVASPPAAERSGAVSSKAAGDELRIVAKDIAYQPVDLTVPAGSVKVTLTNEGTIAHSLVFESTPLPKLETLSKGATDSETVDLRPGTYTFYCEQAGHRPAGMVGTLVVT